MRRSAKHKDKPEMYRFLDYVDELVKIIFKEKACRAFQVSRKDLADNLAGLLYCESFTQELNEFEEKYIL